VQSSNGIGYLDSRHDFFVFTRILGIGLGGYFNLVESAGCVLRYLFLSNTLNQYPQISQAAGMFVLGLFAQAFEVLDARPKVRTRSQIGLL
jgi:hypothetical protein